MATNKPARTASSGTGAAPGTPAGAAVARERRRDRRLRGVPWSGRKNLGHPALKEFHDDRTLGERVADRVARFGGSWPFIFLFLGLIFAWMVLNTLFLARVIHHKQFDPYPYIALNLMLSALAGLQAPVILMSQNRSAARDELLAAHHYTEGRKIEGLAASEQKLLQSNTDITQQIHDLLVANTDLTQRVHDLTEKIHELIGRGNRT